MTKEEAKHLSEILKAYSEGKKIEVKGLDGKWINTREDIWVATNAMTNPMSYRIKPEPKLRPYKNAEEFFKAQNEHGEYLISKCKGKTARLPVIVEPEKIFMFWKPEDSCLTGYKYSDLFNWWLHQDGHPCGIVEEQ